MANLIANLPNSLTYIRILLIPLFVALMVDPSRGMVNLAILIFIIAAITDLADGMIARRFQVVTDTGKLLDPLADKILVMAALVMLVAQRADLDAQPWVPAWMVVFVLAREIWVTGLRAVAASRGEVVAARDVGKIKSLLQMTSIVLLLLHDYRLPLMPRRPTCQLVGENLLLLSVFISYWGAVLYTMSILGSSNLHSSKVLKDN